MNPQKFQKAQAGDKRPTGRILEGSIGKVVEEISKAPTHSPGDIAGQGGNHTPDEADVAFARQIANKEEEKEKVPTPINLVEVDEGRADKEKKAEVPDVVLHATNEEVEAALNHINHISFEARKQLGNTAWNPLLWLRKEVLPWQKKLMADESVLKRDVDTIMNISLPSK